ncbi:DUF2721 domain-containing protein [bacterium]|nr:DUF2721 domain-containing protein [bacterium]
MQIPSVSELIPVLQTAIGPMILISGVGLLLLSMTNRLGRVIDRARLQAGQLGSATAEDRTRIAAQLPILWKRARLIRLAIILAAMSALAAAILIIVLFLTALWHRDTAVLVGLLFIICMLCLIGSLIVFIDDLNRSLAALRLELGASATGDD